MDRDNLWPSGYSSVVMDSILFPSLPIVLVLTLSMLLPNPAALAVSESTDSSIATSATQNFLTVVSFLIGTSSFILGLSIQNASKLTATMNRYFRILILAMVIPSIVIILYGIVVVGSTLRPWRRALFTTFVLAFRNRWSDTFFVEQDP